MEILSLQITGVLSSSRPSLCVEGGLVTEVHVAFIKPLFFSPMVAKNSVTLLLESAAGYKCICNLSYVASKPNNT